MNPGPFGMVQTGVPFGEVDTVRDWMGLEAAVARPAQENPKRPIEGFGCSRPRSAGEGCGACSRERFGVPEAFFAEHYVANYCPLAFFEGGRNLTPTSCRRPNSRRSRRSATRTCAGWWNCSSRSG